MLKRTEGRAGGATGVGPHYAPLPWNVHRLTFTWKVSPDADMEMLRVLLAADSSLVKGKHSTAAHRPSDAETKPKQRRNRERDHIFLESIFLYIHTKHSLGLYHLEERVYFRLDGMWCCLSFSYLVHRAQVFMDRWELSKSKCCMKVASQTFNLFYFYYIHAKHLTVSSRCAEDCG